MKILLLLLSLASLSTPANADIIYLNKGDEIVGDIIKLNAEKVWIQIKEKTQTYNRGEILKIQLVKKYHPSNNAIATENTELKDLIFNPPTTKDYPNAGYVSWLKDTKIKFEKDKSYKISHHNIRYILKERGKSSAGRGKFTYFPDEQKGEIEYALSITKGETAYLNDVSVQRGSENPFSPFYDKMKSLKFSVPNLKPKSIVNYKYNIETPKHNPIYPFQETVVFRYYEPAKLIRLQVEVPKNLKLHYEEVNMPANRLFSKKTKNQITTYTWEMRDIPAFRSENTTPPFMHYAPNIKLSLENNWSQIKKDFEPLLKKRIVITDEIKAKVQEIINPGMNDIQKAEALFNWVNKEIQYQTVGMNSYSFIPTPTDKIFNMKLGNSLDKPFLLYAMLIEAKLKPGFAYLSSKYSSPFIKNLSNIRQFNSAAVTLNLKGKNIILCPLDDNHRYNQIPNGFQGTEGFQILGKKNDPLIFKNPLANPDMEMSHAINTIKINKKGNLKARLVLNPTGNHQVDWRVFKTSKKTETDKFFEKFVHGIHPNARLKNYDIKNLSDLSKDIEISVEYNIKNYALKAGDKYLLFKVPSIKRSAWSVGQTERQLPMYWQTKNKTFLKATISLPKKFKLYYAPKELNLMTAGQEYHGAYKSAKGEIVFTEESTRNKIKISTNDYSSYKTFVQDISKFTDEWIVIEKK
ncbi:MAG: DUF3857 domain-containing protein [Elusimicrobiota bacterium]|nr:DUF3857 domain-containing protein [Elusimicrobiota bacterium]